MSPHLHALVVLVTLVFQTTQPDNDPPFTDPPGEESPQIRALIEAAAAALDGGKDVDAILTDARFMPAHEYPRFRELIRSRATGSIATLVTPDEPGDKLIVSGTIRDTRGQPLADALVYAYQTSAKGWYSDRAAHVRANSGDTKHARLFGYLRTDDQGRYELRTIRPAGYPRSTLPQHIHFHVALAGADRDSLVSEICFDDDPRMTPPVREQTLRNGFLICPVKYDSDGVQRVTADSVVR
jgi:protocatechuate 3,4-dioxygenase beta subunit